jgi:hypothetical protein
MANELVFHHSGDPEDMWYYGDAYDFYSEVSLQGYFKIGRRYIAPADYNANAKAAIRFDNVNVQSGSIDYAGLYLWVQYNGKDLSPRDGNWTFRVYGFDEDDTSAFGSYPFDRSRTTNSENSGNDTDPDDGQYKEINVTAAVEEVMERSGWHSGQAIALWVDAYDCGKQKYAADSTDRLSLLVIRKSAEPNFKPTPKEVAAPTFPTTDSYGMKISYPGYDVDVATEDQTYFTTKKRCMKVVAQGKIDTTGGVVYSIAHGQSVKPFARAFFKSVSSGKRYQIPRFIPGEMQDPDADTTDGQIEIDGTNVKILTTDSCEVYYYIYIDELKA